MAEAYTLAQTEAVKKRAVTCVGAATDAAQTVTEAWAVTRTSTVTAGTSTVAEACALIPAGAGTGRSVG